MSAKDKAETVQAVNYTADQVQILRDSAPVDFEKAKLLAVQLDKKPRSIVAKCLSEGIEYVSKPAPAKRPAKETKEEIVAEISAAIGSDLSGLEKATAKALVTLREYVTTAEDVIQSEVTLSTSD